MARGTVRGLRAAADVADSIDAYDFQMTHLEVYTAHEGDPNALPEPPTSGGSRMLLEMLLVDNKTGMPLWHARQVFPASPASSDDVNEAFRRMLLTLPQR
jgi:hypothetical protein